MLKSTDTILAAFAVLGFVLLAFFAFGSSTTDREIETTDINTSEEFQLITDSEEPVEYLETDDDVEEMELNDVDKAENVSDTEFFATNSVPEETIELITQELAAGEMIDWDRATIRASVENFLQGSNAELREEVLQAVQAGGTVEVLRDGSLLTKDTATLASTDAETVVELAVDNNNQDELATESGDDADEAMMDEVEIESANDSAIDSDGDEVVDQAASEGRISKFIKGLFATDDTPDIGGAGDEIVEDDADSGLDDVGVDAPTVTDGQTLVEAGDTVWDILINDHGFSAAQAAGAINDMRTDTNLAESFGINSGSVDLIFPGQVLNVGVLG